MDRDFSVYVKKNWPRLVKMRVHPTGSMRVEGVIDGTEIHGHVGVHPERYAISISWDKPIEDAKKAIITKSLKDGALAFDVMLKTGQRVTGDSGEKYTLYKGELVT